MKIRLTRRKKDKRKKYLIVFSIVFLLIVMVSGYAAFNTSLSLKAKGNIVERITPEKIKKESCSTESGDGLYKDIYEDGKCFYKGTNPNNYITFNNEEWRIISIENDGALKIMRNKSLINMQWGYSNWGNDWIENSQINTYLNNDYFSSITTNLDKILTYDFYIGAVAMDNNDLTGLINDEKSKTWSGKIGLITVSDYLRANSNIMQCSTVALNNENKENCIVTNWIYYIASKGNAMWTITARDRISNYENDAFMVYTDNLHFGEIKGAGRLDYSQGIVPCLYLSSDIILSGTGTENDPYVITN